MKNFFPNRRLLGSVCIALAVAVLLFIAYQFSPQKKHSISFSVTTMLTSLWQSYTKDYLDPSTYRTLDPDRGNITTSEGQSYTMLRAVWIGDKTTYDREWQWTRTNLSRPGDHLFSWLYGKRADGTYGILTDQSGQNTASDADSDIALSLVLAYSRWQDPAYLLSARAIMQDIWAKEVVTINGVPYLAANDIEKTSKAQGVLVNPSYLSPYAYRIFAKVDPSDPWNSLVDSSYTLIGNSMAADLDATTTSGLPPDWVMVNRASGALSAPAANDSLTTNFGYDALRTPWRLALDWQWNKDSRDKDLLDHMTFLSSTYESDGKLIATYKHDGGMVKSATSTEPYNYESASMYGATIGYFMVSDPSKAQEIYNDKLVYLFDSNNNDWKQRLAYYDDNWAWFGLALYNKALPDFTASLPASAFLRTQP